MTPMLRARDVAELLRSSMCAAWNERVGGVTAFAAAFVLVIMAQSAERRHDEIMTIAVWAAVFWQIARPTIGRMLTWNFGLMLLVWLRW